MMVRLSFLLLTIDLGSASISLSDTSFWPERFASLALNTFMNIYIAIQCFAYKDDTFSGFPDGAPDLVLVIANDSGIMSVLLHQ